MTKLIPRYLHGNPFLIDKSSIPGTSPQTSSTINYDWNRQAENKEAIKLVEKERALQLYLDRRGYISEDKDKRSYAQRDIDDKINATKNAKTDFYSIGAPNAQSTDVTPRQVILPSLLAGFTAAAPLTSLATGAMYEPMEKYGLYKPVSLGLQKLGVNEKTAETLSPFITDPFIWSISSLSKRLTNNNFTRSYLVSRELNRGIKQATKQGDIRVLESYFNNPDKWYRVTETPEVHGIELSGRNVTTSDIQPGTILADDFRRTVGKNKLVSGTGENEGYWILNPERITLFKGGQAHGNTSQAAKGQIWHGNFASSGKFPEVVLEGQGNRPTFRGMTPTGGDSRTNFVLLNWEDIPQGARLGFHTGEMPLDDLRWFQRNPDGTFTFKGSLLPETRISFNPRGELNAPTLNEANEVATLKNDYNTFAQRYHYKHYHGPEDIQSLKQASQELADRHHTFFRGVIPPTKDEDLQKLLDLGIYGLEDLLQYAATHPKFNLKLNGEGVWMSPTRKAFAYGKSGSDFGKVALVRVPYTKNPNRPLYNLDLGQIINPGQVSYLPTTNKIPREVVYTGGTPLEFLGWAPKYQRGLTSKIRENNFGKLSFGITLDGFPGFEVNPAIDLLRKLELNKLAEGEVAPGIPDQARLYKEGIDYNIRGLSPEISDIVDLQIMPRLMEQRDFIANGIHIGDYYRNGINRRKKNIRISEWSNGMMNDYNTLHNTSYGGWSRSDKPFIVINESMPKPLAETHEFRHLIQNETGPMIEEAKALKEAYSDVPNPYSFDYDMRAEWETMNTEARTMLLRKAGYKYDPSLTVKENIEIQNKIIQDYPVEEMLDVLEGDASGYWSNYLKQNFKSGYKKVGEDKFDIPEEKINAWKKAMQIVGVGTGVIATPKLINRE